MVPLLFLPQKYTAKSNLGVKGFGIGSWFQTCRVLPGKENMATAHEGVVAGARIWLNPVHAHTGSRERKQGIVPGYWTPPSSDKLLPAIGDPAFQHRSLRETFPSQTTTESFSTKFPGPPVLKSFILSLYSSTDCCLLLQPRAFCLSIKTVGLFPK